MARVYDTPCYTGETDADWCVISIPGTWKKMEEIIENTRGNSDATTTGGDEPDMSHNKVYKRAVVDAARRRFKKMSETEMEVRIMIRDVIVTESTGHDKHATVFVDDRAVFRLFALHINRRSQYTPSPRLHTHPSGLELQTKLATLYGLIGSKVSGQTALEYTDTASSALAQVAPEQCFDAASDAWVKGGFGRNMTPEALWEKMFNEDAEDKLDAIKVNSALSRMYQSLDFYYALGTLFVVDRVTNTVFVLCENRRQHLGLVLKSWQGMWRYSLDPACRRFKQYADAWQQTKTYITSSLIKRTKSRDPKVYAGLAQQMKTSYAAILPELGATRFDSEEMTQSQTTQRDALVESAKEKCYMEMPWFNIISSWCPKIAADMGTAWNLLPPIDNNIKLVGNRLRGLMSTPGPTVLSNEQTLFISYSRSVVSSHLLVRDVRAGLASPSNVPNFKTPNGADAEFAEVSDIPEWLMDNLEGHLRYAKPEEMGNLTYDAKIPWEDHITNWHFTASDVTHVGSNLSAYSALNPSQRNKYAPRELTWALTHGSQFEGGATPSDVKRALNDGSYKRWTKILETATKSENTKVWTKARETCSASDHLREVLTELDKNISQLASALCGVTTRMSAKQAETEIARLSSRAEDDRFVAISADVTGWSPQMPLVLQKTFINLLLEFFDKPAIKSIDDVWSNLKIVLCKRGSLDMFDMLAGSIQGFFGTIDTILHSMLVQYAFRRGKSEKLCPMNSTISHVVLIDDMAASFPLAEDATPLQAFEMICRVYKALGFEIDAIKSLVATGFFHFLNRIYSHGREVVTAAKIAAKVWTPVDRRIPSLHGDVDALVTSSSSAASRGARGVWMYTIAVHETLRLLKRKMFNAPVGSPAWVIQLFLPRNMGGLGFPSFCQWATRDTVDPMMAGVSTLMIASEYLTHSFEPTSLMCQHAMYVGSFVTESLKMPLTERTSVAIIDNPASAKYAHVMDIDAPRRLVFRDAALSLPLHDDFRGMMTAQMSDEYTDVVNELLTSTAAPSQVFEEFAATLPHAFASAITAKMEASEGILDQLPRSYIKKKAQAIRMIERKHVRSMMLRHDAHRVSGDAVVGSLTHQYVLDARIRQSQLDGVHINTMRQLSSMETFGMPAIEWTGGPAPRGGVIVTSPSMTGTELADGPVRCKMAASRCSVIGGAVTSLIETARTQDPLMTCFLKANRLFAVLRECHIPYERFQLAHQVLWGLPNGVKLMPAPIVCESDNVRRVLGALRKSSYMTSLNPNMCRAVTVNMTSMLDSYKRGHSNIDPMMMRHALIAHWVAELELSGTEGLSRALVVSEDSKLRETGEIYRHITPFHPKRLTHNVVNTTVVVDLVKAATDLAATIMRVRPEDVTMDDDNDIRFIADGMASMARSVPAGHVFRKAGKKQYRSPNPALGLVIKRLVHVPGRAQAAADIVNNEVDVFGTISDNDNEGEDDDSENAVNDDEDSDNDQDDGIMEVDVVNLMNNNTDVYVRGENYTSQIAQVALNTESLLLARTVIRCMKAYYAGQENPLRQLKSIVRNKMYSLMLAGWYGNDIKLTIYQPSKLNDVMERFEQAVKTSDASGQKRYSRRQMYSTWVVRSEAKRVQLTTNKPVPTEQQIAFFERPDFKTNKPTNVRYDVFIARMSNNCGVLYDEIASTYEVFQAEKRVSAERFKQSMLRALSRSYSNAKAYATWWICISVGIVDTVHVWMGEITHQMRTEFIKNTLTMFSRNFLEARSAGNAAARAVGVILAPNTRNRRVAMQGARSAMMNMYGYHLMDAFVVERGTERQAAAIAAASHDNELRLENRGVVQQLYRGHDGPIAMVAMPNNQAVDWTAEEMVVLRDLVSVTEIGYIPTTRGIDKDIDDLVDKELLGEMEQPADVYQP